MSAVVEIHEILTVFSQRFSKLFSLPSDVTASKISLRNDFTAHFRYWSDSPLLKFRSWAAAPLLEFRSRAASPLPWAITVFDPIPAPCLEHFKT